MKRLVLAASLVLALVGAGCDDDPDPTPTRDGGADAQRLDGAAAETGGATMCTGTFAMLTRGQLTAASRPGQCTTTTSDLDYICTGDIATRARNCANTCLQSGSANPANCVSVCIQQNMTLTAGCADCYRVLVECSAMMCSACLTDPNSAECRMCQVTRCYPDFFRCSGLPGGAPPADAGADVPATETGADTPTGDARDGGADAPPDAADGAVADASDAG
jgi:hypothetical protein